MRRDPRTIAYLFAFLFVYLLITGVLVLFLRSLILEDRLETREALEERVRILDETMRVRADQERAIILELMSIEGARDFEQAYVLLRTEIEELSERYAAVEGAATTERDLRIETVRERDHIVSRVQALNLETSRLEANLEACIDALSSCSDC